MGAVQPALPLCSVPGAAVREVLVAVRLELVPAQAADLSVWKEEAGETTSVPHWLRTAARGGKADEDLKVPSW